QAFQPDIAVVPPLSAIIERPDIEPPLDSPARRAVRQSLTYGAGELQVPDPVPNSPYRILLRGPWQAEPLSRDNCGDFATINSSDTQLPLPTPLRLPRSS